jgi:hypothetical protein
VSVGFCQSFQYPAFHRRRYVNADHLVHTRLIICIGGPSMHEALTGCRRLARLPTPDTIEYKIGQIFGEMGNKI